MNELIQQHEMAISLEGEDSIRAKGRLLPDHPHLNGHFEGFPLLPAVSQLDIVQGLAEMLLDRPLQIIACTRAKFAAMLQPGRSFEITVTLTPLTSGGQWLMKDGGDIFSKGCFTYAVTPPQS